MANPWEYLSDADKKRYGIVDRPPQAPQPTGADYATNLHNSARDALAGIGLSPDLLSAPTAPTTPASSDNGLSVLGNIFQHKPDLPAYQPSDSGGGGFLGKVAGLGADLRDTAGDVAHGRIGALGTDAKDAVMGVPGALSSVTLDPAAQYVGKPFFGIAGSVLSEPIDPVTGQRKQQNIFEQLSDPGNFLGGIKEGLLHPQRAANAMDARARENYGAIGQAAYNVADQPFSYVGPGAVGALKGILPEGIAASRSVNVLGGLLNQGGGRAVVGGALGGIAGQQGAEALGLPDWAQTGAALAGGVVGGGIGLKARMPTEAEIKAAKLGAKAGLTLPVGQITTDVANRRAMRPWSETYTHMAGDYLAPDGSVLKSSRFNPLPEGDFKVGEWAIDDMKMADGHQIWQLREMDPAALSPSEQLDQLRAGDSARYAEWTKGGSPIPPIKAVETETGKLRVIDGHRRLEAAKETGQPIRVWVSDYVENPKRLDSNGNPMRTPLTYELANAPGSPLRQFPTEPSAVEASGVGPEAEAAKAELAALSPTVQAPDLFGNVHDTGMTEAEHNAPASPLLPAGAAPRESAYQQSFDGSVQQLPGMGGTQGINPGINVPENVLPRIGNGTISADHPHAETYLDALDRNGIEFHYDDAGHPVVTDTAEVEAKIAQLYNEAIESFQGTKSDLAGVDSFSFPFGSPERAAEEAARRAQNGGVLPKRSITRTAPRWSMGAQQAWDDAQRLSELISDGEVNPLAELNRQPFGQAMTVGEATPLEIKNQLLAMKQEALAHNATLPEGSAAAGYIRAAVTRQSDANAATVARGIADADAFINAHLTAEMSPSAVQNAINTEIDRFTTTKTKFYLQDISERAYLRRLQQISDSLSENGHDAVYPLGDASAASADQLLHEAGGPEVPQPSGMAEGAGTGQGTLLEAPAAGGPPAAGVAQPSLLPPVSRSSTPPPTPEVGVQAPFPTEPTPSEPIVSRGRVNIGGKPRYTVNGREVSRSEYNAAGETLGSATGRGAGGTPPLPPAPPTSGPPLPPMSGDFARSVPIPDVGIAGAQARIAAKAEAVHTQGPLADKLYRYVPGSKKLSSLINPSVAQDPQVHVAQLTRAGTLAERETQFNTAMAPRVAAVEKAMIETPAKYVGPDGNKIVGTFKDIADHPEDYQIPPQLRVALDDYGRTQWENVSLISRTEDGVDVKPYDSGISGSIYAPTVASKASREAKLEASGGGSGNAGIGASSMAKERAYAGARDRMRADPTFQPETGVRELTALHNRAMATNSANSTFKLAAGGKTRAEMMELAHPKLVTMRDEAVAKVQSLQGKLATAESRSATGTTVSDELSKALEAARNADPETDFGQVETALRNSNKRLDVLLGRRDISAADAANLRASLSDARDELTHVRDAWRKADPTTGTGYEFSPVTNQYHPPAAVKTLKEISRSASGFGEGLVNAFDNVRATHLTWDGSPLFVQGLQGFFMDPVVASKTIASLVLAHADPRAALARTAAEDPHMVARFSFATGRPFGEQLAEFQPKGLNRIPGIGPKMQGLEDRMFAITQNMGFQQWKKDTAFLQKQGKSAIEADHEAANMLGKIIPGLNPDERGLSPLRQSVERAALTSTSFAATPALLVKDMTSALAKMATLHSVDGENVWRSLNGREQLALIRGGTLLSTMTAVAGASAAISAESRGKSPLDAIQEAMDPRSKYFMSIQLGDGRTVPIGGPLRSFIRGIAPAPGETVPGTQLGKWAYGKLNSPISGALSLFRNEDYRGAKIRSGDFPSQLFDSLRYGFEQVAPTSIGAVSADLRAGQNPLQIGVDVGGQLLGANPSLPSASEQLNQIARDYPGSNGKDFYSLEPYQQDEIKKLHPDLWAQKVAAGQDSTQQAQLIKDKVSAQQQASDAQLLAGTLTPKDWADQRTQRLAELRGAEDVIYQGKSNPKPPTDPTKIDAYIAQGGTARDRFFRAIDAYSDPGTGAPNWDKVDEWQAAQPQADQDYIARNIGLGGTPLEKLRRQLSSDYYGMPEFGGKINGQAISLKDAGDIKDLLNLVHGNTKTTVGVRTNPALYVATLQKMAQSGQVDKNSVAYKGAIRGLLGLLPDNPDRAKYRKAHPEVALLSSKTPLNPQQVAAIQSRLGTIGQAA